jgi:hypothetical protein
MKQLQTEIMIQAPANKVWNKLMDFNSYPKWNPFIKSISGEKKQGGKLKVLLQPPGDSSMVFKPRILSLKKEKEFRWLGRTALPGIFDEEHYFIISETKPQEVKFIHGEKFSGFLVGALSKILDNTKEGCVLMNIALKNECENSHQ